MDLSPVLTTRGACSTCPTWTSSASARRQRRRYSPPSIIKKMSSLVGEVSRPRCEAECRIFWPMRDGRAYAIFTGTTYTAAQQIAWAVCDADRAIRCHGPGHADSEVERD